MTEPERFDRLNAEARKVLSYAQEEAQRFNHNYIGTEHLLLGLIRQQEGEQSIAAVVLARLGVQLDRTRRAVEFIIGRGDRIVLGESGLTPRAKQVIELAFDEARRMSHDYIGSEHLLLGLVREGEGIAAGVLESLGVNLEKVRQAVLLALWQPIPESKTDEPEEPPSQPAAHLLAERWGYVASSSPFGASPIPTMEPLAGPRRRYRPWHIDTAQPSKTAVGNGTTPKPIPLAPQGIVFGTLLGWVVVNTGGQFTLTLYDGLEDDTAPLAVITNPPTGAFFPFHCLLHKGLTYTLEGTPGSVTIIYDEVREPAG